MVHDGPKPTPAEALGQLGTLFAGFAHEIRNPLSTIGLNLQLVLEELATGDSPRDRRTHKRLAVVESEVKRLQGILDEFLQFVRTPQLRRQRTAVHTWLQAIVDFSAPEMQAAGVALKSFFGSDVGKLDIDPDQMRQVIVNLLRNALAACATGGEVLVAARRAGEQVIIQVTDTGVGMDAEVRSKVFTPYFSTKKGGTGLGLALARRIVEDHAGTVELTSERGKGTQLTIRLPAVPESAVGEVPA